MRLLPSGDDRAAGRARRPRRGPRAVRRARRRAARGRGRRRPGGAHRAGGDRPGALTSPGRGGGCGPRRDAATATRARRRRAGRDAGDLRRRGPGGRRRLAGVSTPAELVRRHTGDEWTRRVLRLRPGLRLPHRGVARLGRAAPGVPAHPGARRGRSRWPGSSAASTRASRPAAGSCSAGPTLVLFDLDREPAALLRPGVRVRFVPVDRRDRSVTVLATGPLTHRAGRRPARSGRARRRPLRRLRPRRRAGWPTGWWATPTDAAVLEVTFGGAGLRAGRRLVVATTGARCAGRAAHNAPACACGPARSCASAHRVSGAADATSPSARRRGRRRPGARLAVHRPALRARAGAGGGRRRPARSGAPRRPCRAWTSPRWPSPSRGRHGRGAARAAPGLVHRARAARP